jgi:choline dehydrogenase
MLKSPDPLQAPAILPNYLADPEDVHRLVAGLHRMRQIFATEPLASRTVAETQPGPSVISDDQLADYVRSSATTGYHPVGTCKMGNDSMAVVDQRLRVRGIDRLRVVDASIMPTIIMGNTNAPSMMIGDKGADMIRADALPRRSFPR